jgi:hypothetical protein
MAPVIFILVIVAIAIGIPLFIIQTRRSHLRELLKNRRVLVELTKDVLTNRSEKTINETGHSLTIEGTIAGRPDTPTVRVGISYPESLSAQYISTGYHAFITPETTVTVGLLGATPRFELTARSKAAFVADDLENSLDTSPPTELDIKRAWNVELDAAMTADVMNDELRTELMRLLLRVRTITSLCVDPEGLEVSFANTNTRELRAALDFAIMLRAKILESVEKRAREAVSGPRLGYRVAVDPDAPAEEAEGEAKAEAEAEAEAGATYSSRRTS